MKKKKNVSKITMTDRCVCCTAASGTPATLASLKCREKHAWSAERSGGALWLRVQQPNAATRWLLRLDDPVYGALDADTGDSAADATEQVVVHASLATLMRLVVGATQAREVRELSSPDHDALVLEAVDPASAAERSDALWNMLSRVAALQQSDAQRTADVAAPRAADADDTLAEYTPVRRVPRRLATSAGPTPGRRGGRVAAAASDTITRTRSRNGARSLSRPSAESDNNGRRSAPPDATEQRSLSQSSSSSSVVTTVY